MPRHPIGETAMTDAQRQRKRRERLRQAREAAAPQTADRAQLAEARAEIERLKQQLAAKAAPAAAKAAPPSSQDERQALGKWMHAQLEIDRLRRQLEEARKAEPEQLAALRRRIIALEQESARRDRAAKAARTKAANAAAAAPIDGEKDPRIAQLEKMNSDLRKRIARMRANFEESLNRKGRMTFAAEAVIAKALHPDATPSHKEREEAYKAFTAWKADSKAAQRR